MAHAEQHPAPPGSRRDLPPAPGGGRYVPPPWGRAAGAARPNPVSWAIAELQGDLERPEPSPGTATLPRPGFEEAPTAAGDRGPGDPPQFLQGRPATHPVRSPVGPAPGEGLEALGTCDLPPLAIEVPVPPGAADPTPVPVLSAAPATVSAPPPGVGRLLLTAVVALVSGMIGGLIVAGLPGVSHPADDASRPGTAPKAAPAPPLAAVAVGPKPEAIDTLHSRLGQLAETIDALGERIERVEARKPEPPAGLDDLRDQVGRLDATTEGLAPLPGEFRRIDSHVTNLAAMLKGLRDELVALRAKAEKGAASTPEPERPAGGEASPATDQVRTLAQGIKLFKQKRFKEALGIFNLLELTLPDDARVWYFAALSQGCATGQWDGGTERLVEKGIARERAGTPSSLVIDSAVSDLTSALGRDWLAEYRRRGLGNPAGAPAHTPGSER